MAMKKVKGGAKTASSVAFDYARVVVASRMEAIYLAYPAKHEGRTKAVAKKAPVRRAAKA
jgi:hypothetical protein